jgi:hypothetical protein
MNGSGFAGAILAQQTKYFSLLYFQVEVMERRKSIIIFRQ